MQPKGSDTVEKGDSQSNIVFAVYPQIVELKKCMIYSENDER